MDWRSGQTKVITSGVALLPWWALLWRRNLFTWGWLLFSGIQTTGRFIRAGEFSLTPLRPISGGKHSMNRRFGRTLHHSLSLCLFFCLWHYFVAQMAATTSKMTPEIKKKLNTTVSLNGWTEDKSLWMFTSPLDHPYSLLQTTLQVQADS